MNCGCLFGTDNNLWRQILARIGGGGPIPPPPVTGDFILMEDSGFVLQENGDNILLE